MARNRNHASSGAADFSRLLVGEPSDEGGDLPDLVEEDVWSVMCGREAAEPTGRREHRRRVSRGRSVGGLSLAFDGDGGVDDGPMPRVLHQYHDVAAGFGVSGCSQHRRRRGEGHVVASSAPMDVPAWPQALREDSDAAAAVVEVEEGEVWMPPHEYIQRRDMAAGVGGSSGRVATSVLEGAGRTLKGRDMSRVRDAVWRQTGFFG